MVTSRRTLVWRAENPRSRARYGSQYNQRSNRSSRERYSSQDGRRRSYRDQPRRAPSRRNMTSEKISRAKAEGYGRHYIQKQIRNKTPMIFEMYDGPIQGVILHRLPYNLIIRSGRERLTINKLDIKFCYKQKTLERIRPHIQIDAAVQSKQLAPVVERSERYHIEDRLLLECYRNRYPVTVTLRGGEIIPGIVDWYSKYEIKLEVKKRQGVLVFRHAIYHLEVHRSPTR